MFELRYLSYDTKPYHLFYFFYDRTFLLPSHDLHGITLVISTNFRVLKILKLILTSRNFHLVLASRYARNISDCGPSDYSKLSMHIRASDIGRRFNATAFLRYTSLYCRILRMSVRFPIPFTPPVPLSHAHPRRRRPFRAFLVAPAYAFCAPVDSCDSPPTVAFEGI